MCTVTFDFCDPNLDENCVTLCGFCGTTLLQYIVAVALLPTKFVLGPRDNIDSPLSVSLSNMSVYFAVIFRWMEHGCLGF